MKMFRIASLITGALFLMCMSDAHAGGSLWDTDSVPPGAKPAYGTGFISAACNKGKIDVLLSVAGARQVKVRIHDGRSYGSWMAMDHKPQTNSWNDPHALPVPRHVIKVEYAVGNTNGWSTGLVGKYDGDTNAVNCTPAG